MAGITLSYRETLTIRAFLGYLHKNYSRSISSTDPYVIAAVAAWFLASTGGGTHYQYNNPFHLRASSTTRIVVDPDTEQRRSVTVVGKLLRFTSLAAGFVAAAKALIGGAGDKLIGYRLQLVLNSLKRTGNQAAVDFLAALAMSQWDAAGPGVSNWQDAYNKDKNKLLGFYLTIKGVQLTSPRKPRPAKRPPTLPRDYNYVPIARQYLDPWAAGVLYRNRHGHSTRATTGRSRP